jgi:hypothetical protein
MGFSSVGYPVRVTKIGAEFELSIHELALVVRERDLGFAWSVLQRRLDSLRKWTAEIGLAFPPVSTRVG